MKVQIDLCVLKVLVDVERRMLERQAKDDPARYCRHPQNVIDNISFVHDSNKLNGRSFEAKTILLITTTSAAIVYIYGCGRPYKDAFTSILFRLRPQLVATSAERPFKRKLRK